jgi:recombinase
MDAVQRNARAGKRTGGGSRPFGYKINRQDLGEGAPRRWRIVGEELEPAEADAVREAVSRVLRGESLRSIAFDFNKRGIKPGGEKKNGESKIDKWQGSTLRRVLLSPRIAGLREHNGEVVGKAVWPAIIDEATHDRLVGLLKIPADGLSTTADLGCTVGWIGPLRIMRRAAGQLPPAEAGSRLRVPEGREPSVSCASPHRRRAAGGVRGGLGHRPVAESRSHQDRSLTTTG